MFGSAGVYTHMKQKEHILVMGWQQCVCQCVFYEMAQSLLSKSHVFDGHFREIDNCHGEPTHCYGAATMSRLLTIIGLFCRI